MIIGQHVRFRHSGYRLLIERKVLLLSSGILLLFHGPMTRGPEPRDYLRSPSFHYLHGAETKQKDEPMVNRNRRDSLGAPSIPVLRTLSELLQ